MTLIFKRTAVLLLVTASLIVGIIQAGSFDPKSVGSLQAVVQPGSVSVPASETALQWLEVSLPNTDFSVRMTAVLRAGSFDSLYGAALQTASQIIHVTLSPLGYVSIAADSPPDLLAPSRYVPTTPLPLQTWPHVRTGTTPNEIWLDVIEGQMTVRINRELLWSGALEGAPERIGVIGQSFEETAVIHFQSVEIFAAP